MDRIIYRSQSHRTYTGKNCHFTARHIAHIVPVMTADCMILSVKGSYYAWHRFRQWAIKIGFSLIRQKTAPLHYYVRNDCISRASAYVPKRIARRRIRVVRHIERGLNSKLTADFELTFPLTSHFNNLSAKFMPYHDWILIYIIRHTFMLFPLNGSFICRHAYTVGYDVR